MKPVLAVLGPTATGKSSLALMLAGRLDDAMTYYERAREELGRIGSRLNAAMATLGVAEIQSDRGERDEAEREAPCEAYPWDGVRNVRPFSGFASTVVEGVY